MKLIKWILIIVLIGLVIGWFTGSRPTPFEVDPVIEKAYTFSLTMDEYVATQEAHYNFRSGNQAQIVWADSSNKKTPYSLVYLHGFSASQMEGNPVHRALAKRYGMNLYLPRLSEHGLKGERPLEDLTASDFVESAKEALQVGQEIGDDVIVIGTSTGATLAIYLAAFNPDLIDGLIFYAPNIDVADSRSFLLTYPWGKELAEFLEGDELSQGMSGPEFDKYWYPTYRTSSVVELLSLIEHTMTEEIFHQVQQPTFISYYYEDEENKDKIISTDAIQTFYKELGTPNHQKILNTSPESGNHVIISDITSKDILTPFNQTCEFIQSVMKVPVVDSTDTKLLLEMF